MIRTLCVMTHEEIIKSWTRLSDFAEDLGIAYGTAKAMRRRGSIPPEYWLTVSEKASKRRIKNVTLKVLAEAAARSRENAA